MNEGKINLKCSDFMANVLNSFKTLHGSELFTDVTLVSDDNKQIHAHKLILSAGSVHFRDILSDESHEQPMLRLNDVSYENLDWIIKYLYVGEVSLPQSSLQKFLRIANKLKCFGLKEEGPQGSELEKVEEKYAGKEMTQIASSNVEVAESLAEEEVKIVDSTDHRPILIKTEHEIVNQTLSNTEERTHEPNEEQLHTKIEQPKDFDTDLKDSTTPFIKNDKVDILDQKNAKQILRRRTKLFPEKCRIDGKTISKCQLKELLNEYYFPGLHDSLYHCNCCIKSFKSRGHIMEHVQKHVNNLEFDCDTCGIIVQSTPALRAHIQNKHRSLEKYKCGECSYEAWQLGSFKEHIAVKHNNIMQKCSQCDYQATRKSQVRKHMRKKHMEEDIIEKNDNLLAKIDEVKKIYLIEKVKDNTGSNFLIHLLLNLKQVSK